jgi:hypothetical protein
MKYYQQPIRMWEETVKFSTIELGKCFVMAEGQTISFGNLFMGFETYMKTSEYDSRSIQDGVLKTIELDQDVYKVSYRPIERRE